MVRARGVLASASGLQPGDHACAVFRTDEEYLALVGEYLAEGIAMGQRALCFFESIPDEAVAAAIDARGVSSAEAIKGGRLVFVPAPAAYAPDGVMVEADMLAAFAQHSAQAVADGFEALRAAGEMAFVVPSAIDAGRLVSYEHEADRVTARSPLVGLCAYDARRCAGTLVRDLQSVHNVTVAPSGAAEPPFRLVADSDGTLALEGEVDVASARTLHLALDGAVRADGDVRIDVGALRFVDVAGMRAIVEAAAACAARDARLVACSPSPLFRRFVDLFDAASLVALE